MPKQFKIGDHVRWTSEAEYATGTIVKIDQRSFNYKGYTHHATKDDPQYEIKSDKRTMWRLTREKRCKRSMIFNSRQSIYGSKELFQYPDNNCRYCIFRWVNEDYRYPIRIP